MADTPDPTDATAVAAAAAHAQLDRILGSDLFAGSARLSRLLRFVVERTVEGRGDEIKEYVLGAEVFDRGVDYDPRLDSIVRVEARRLRSKLDEYYAGSGASDPIVIRMRRGSYVPQFEARPAVVGGDAGPHAGHSSRSSGLAGPTPLAPRARTRRGALISAGLVLVLLLTAAALTWRPVSSGSSAGGGPPRLAVLQATHYPADAESAALADRITDGVTGELVRLGRLEIVSRTSTRQFAGEARAVRGVAAALDADWIIEATVHRETGGVRVEVRLVDPWRDRKVWVEGFTGDTDNLRDLDRRIATAIDVQVGRAVARGTASGR